MLTNEQRAHDLTIALVQSIMSNNSVIPTDCEPDENGNINKDAFKLYIGIYKSAINAMNREFND